MAQIADGVLCKEGAEDSEGHLHHAVLIVLVVVVVAVRQQGEEATTFIAAPKARPLAVGSLRHTTLISPVSPARILLHHLLVLPFGGVLIALQTRP